MPSLENFLTQIIIEKRNGEKYFFPVRAYAVDKLCGKQILRNELRMGSFPCCDYIYISKEKILLLEDSNLIAKKKDLENNDLRGVEDTETKNELCRKFIKNENLSKAHGTLLLHCRLISKDKQARKLMENKEIDFWIIINDAHDVGDCRAFDYLKSRLEGSLKPLVSSVYLLPPEEAKDKLCELEDSPQSR